MFYHRMKPLEYQEVKQVDDGLGCIAEQLSDAGTALFYIIRTSNEDYTANEMNLRLSQYSGYSDKEMKRGSVVDGRYRVEDCFPARHGYALYLSSLGGDAE